MNNLNKKIIILLLLITSFLGINTVNAIDKKIEVTDFSVKDKSGTILVEDPVITDNVVTSNITFNEVGDFVTFKLVLKNNESKKYKIESITDNNSNKNITIDYSFSKNYIKKGETSTVEMKLTYKNKLINKEKVSLNDLTIKINLVNEDGKSSEIIINPTTGDAILHYMILLILALTGLILNVNKKKLKGFKVGSLMIVLSVVLIPFVALANERYEVQIKFNNIDVIGEYETYNITIDPKNGDPAVTKQITYGEKIGALPTNPTKDGYTFDKWVDNKGNKVTEDTTITGPISIEAKYNIVKYDITYNLDGGSVSGNPTKYTIEDTITLKNPSKQGYTFTGWTGTGIDTQTTSVTIPVGSTGARNYVAHYSASEDTAYTVIHKFAKLTEGYDIEEVTEHGTTGSTVPAPRKTRTGFVTPSVQNVTIAADGSASVTYIYERETYAFSITDRTYLDSTSTADGTYPYGTEITLKAQNRPGYTFTWSDGNDNYERTFELEGTTSLTPVYTANTNTKYVVKHYKQKVTLDGYEIADTQNLEGTTDSPITPAVNTYTGFVSPATQTTTINGDGSTVVTYNYDRETYAFSVTDRTYLDTTSTADGTYPYGKEITVKAATKPGYTFIKWSNNETSNPYTFTLEGAVSINPVFEANTNTPYTVLHKKQNLDDLTKYTTADTDNLTGTTDTDATPAVRSYAGFTAPATQTKNIDGNGNTTFEYLYTRNLYTLTITHPEYVVEDKSGSYYYEDTVSLTAIDRPGYTFAGWSTGENTKTITVNIGDSNITVEPLYTSNTDTTYKVIHKYAKLTSGYDTEEVPGTGTTGDTIPAPRQPRTGFVTPAEQNITITADGQASVTYIYERVEYTFEVTNRSYLDNTSTPNGSYLYETTINLKALAREGYTFAWSDEVTALERSFNIDKNTSLSLVYIPNVYTIEFDPNTGEGDMEDQDMSYDETDNLIPNTFTKEGYSFVGWNTRADGQGTPYLDEAEVTNLATSGTITLYAQWIINEYTVSFNTDGGSTVPSQTIAHGGKVTRPAIDPTKTGCTFDDWYTTDSFETVFDFENTTITSDTTIYAKFEEDSFSEVFSEPGECTFNGSSGVLTGDNCSYANGTNKYIDTGINLYNNENHDKDYEIGFTIVSYNPSEQVKQATFMNTKLEGNNYPGLVFRRRDNYDNLDFSSRKTSSTNERKFLDYTDGMKVKIYRITNEETGIQEIFYSINDEEKIKINDLSQFNPEFDLSVWFGAAPTNASATAAQRILVNTTLKDMYIKLGTYQEEKSTTYTVQLDANGGSVSPTSITKDKGLAVGELPTPTPPEGKTFDGWYTGITEGVKVDETYMPNINTKIFARYIDDCPSPVSFSSDSWDTIVCNVKKNNISKYTVGSTRTVSLSGLGTHTLRVANTSTPDECNGTGFSKTACGFVVEFSDVINVHNMDNEGNAGGWKDSDMRTYVNDTIYNALPTDLKNSIIDTKVVSEHSSASDAVNNTTIDKLYLLSKNEIVTNTAKEFTRELDYYEKTVISPCSYNNCVVLKKYTNYYALYWLRTPYDSSNTSYAYVDSNGFVPRYDVATNSNVGVSPAFRIGNPDSDNVEFNNITFDLKNGNTLQSVIEKGSSLSSLTNLTNQSLPFEGWYIDENYETKLTNSTVPSGNTTYFAKWKYTCEDNDDSVTLSSTSCSNNENITIGDGIVCKRAVKLHEETCQQNSSFAYCSKAGYSYGDTITYGSCGTSGMLNSGDAFTCDVNGDGSFDELTERFYYISDYYNTSTKTFDSDTAVLLYYNSVKNGISCNSRLSPDVPYDNSNENWHGPVSAYGMLPSTTVWSNVSLKNSTRQLLNEEGNATVKSHDLGLFNYNDKAARLLTIQELKIACGDNINDTSYLNSCDYVLENTSYSSEDNFRNYLTWLENPKSTTNNMVLSYVSSDGNRAYTFSAYDDLSVRPAIEVPKESIAIGELPSFTVTFETDGGSAVSTQTITYGNTATRPATDPSKTGYTFDDWYTNDNYSTKFDFSTPITNNTTIYAKFDNPCKTFSTDSWETIRDNLENDSNYYAVGCEKQVELDMKGDSNPKLYTVRLVNTSTPDVCNIEGFSQTGCGFVIDFVYNVSGREMNIPTTNEGGWKETSMVTYLNSEFYNKLPLDLKNVIIPTYPIVSGSGQNGISEDILASDIDKNKIYLLSSREVGFDHSYDNKNNILTDTRTLDYYVGSDQSELDSKRKKYTIRTDSSIGTADWWLRNAIDINTGSFDGVSNYGTAYGDSSYRVHGVTPAFRIGTNQ